MTTRERVVQTLRFMLSATPDRSHAERTARLLREGGADEELISAGLLHDQAKPDGTRLWHRVTGVLLAAFAPPLRAHLARGDSTLARYLDHARRGAELARAQGSSDRVVSLIARHHDRPLTEDERRLARADHEALP